MKLKITKDRPNKELRKLYRAWGSKNDLPHAFQSESYFIVATVEKKIVAACQLIIFLDIVWGWKRGYIENVYVLKEYRRGGIGQAMMFELEHLARRLNCHHISLTTNKTRIEAANMYVNLGYSKGFSFSKEL